MKKTNLKLRGKIVEHCGTVAEFARILQLSTPAVSNKINGESNWNIRQIVTACKVLELPMTTDTLREYFGVQ